MLKVVIVGIASFLAIPVLAQSSTTNSQSTCEEAQVDCGIEQSEEKSEDIERITIFGHALSHLSSDAQGYYVLDEQRIKDYSFGNGNLNELLAILPGVQFSEEAYSATQVSNIRPAEVSISGAQGYQTAYLIDGVSNNSKLSTGNAQADRNLVQDVSGHSQQSFINTKILGDVQVFDSNIPAQYGGFSGGLVIANTRDAKRKPEYGANIRYTGDQLVEYHRLLAPDFDGSTTLGEADFSKLDVNAYFATPLTKTSGLVAQLQVLQSSETFDQLGVFREQTQVNYNGLLKYHNQLTPKDHLEIRLLYAPYEGDYFDVNALDSDYSITGGGTSLLLKWESSKNWAQMNSQFSWSRSENSKHAPNIWYVWRNLPGRDWGSYNSSSSSSAGGYGDIEKIQQDWSWRQNFLFNSFTIANTQHTFNTGYQVSQQNIEFNRLEDSILYNGAAVSTNIDCGSFVIDCIETSFNQPIEEIEASLGRPLDLLNTDDFLLFQNNIVTTGQYFQTRQLSPKSESDADIHSIAAYAEHNVTVGNLDVTYGLRYEFNDFFQNHNIAPRIRADYLLADSYQFIVGLNRYYDADLINYKLNEAIEPFISQVRSTSNNRPGQWLSAVVPSGPRYLYVDTNTPFSDELALTYRQPLLWGKAEIKYLARANNDSISRSRSFNELGESIWFAENNGSSRYERLSFVWAGQFGAHTIQLNLSKSTNQVDESTFDGETTLSVGNAQESALNFNYDDSDLVYLRESVRSPDGSFSITDNLITRNDLALERQDANRPFVANLSWSIHYQAWSFSAHARYFGKQNVVYATNDTAPLVEADSICVGCLPNTSEYEVFTLTERPDFTLINASLRYQLTLQEKHHLTFSVDAQNLFNARTHQVGPFTTGLELGRQIWLGISYDH